MKIYTEVNLTSFDFWSGAKDHSFEYSELNYLEDALEDCYPDGCSDTNINDLFWFEEEYLCQLIGLDYENEYLNR